MPHARPVLRSTVPVPAPPLFEYVSPNATDIWTSEGFSRLKPDDIPVFIMEALRNDVDSGLKVSCPVEPRRRGVAIDTEG